MGVSVVAQLTLSVGKDNFRKLRENGDYYIDKTLMIKDFLTYKNEVALITRPRRFGKTLNMTMLREFFDITKDSRAIFEGLAIMETEYADQLNSKPVIYLTFKNCSGANIDDLKDSMAHQMLKEYIRFFKEFRGKVDEDDIDYFAFYQTFKALKKVLDERPQGEKEISLVDTGIFRRSLTTLIEVVNTFYEHPPILLIDEYDQPLINAHIKNFRETFSEDIYADFLGEALKGNEDLGQNLLTGIQRIAKESIFSKLNNFIVYSVTSEKYASYFGLTESETIGALKDYGFEHSEEIRNYYDGYRFGGIEIYNPWSILSFIDTKELKPHWLHTSTNKLIRELIASAESDFKEEFEELIKDGVVDAYVNLSAAFIELETPETLWGLLVNSGYLTITHDLGWGEYSLRIPNQEVKEEFRSIVAIYAGLGENRVRQLFSALMKQNMDRFLKIYQKMVYDSVSYYDVKPDDDEKSPSENSYHMLFLGMSMSMSGMYKSISNRESGDGRSDIIMESLQPNLRPHIVIEFKQGDNLEMLKHEALDQIFEKKYYAQLVGHVLCIGIAHKKKSCELVYKEIVVDEYGTILK